MSSRAVLSFSHSVFTSPLREGLETTWSRASATASMLITDESWETKGVGNFNMKWQPAISNLELPEGVHNCGQQFVQWSSVFDRFLGSNRELLQAMRDECRGNTGGQTRGHLPM